MGFRLYGRSGRVSVRGDHIPLGREFFVNGTDSLTVSLGPRSLSSSVSEVWTATWSSSLRNVVGYSWLFGSDDVIKSGAASSRPLSRPGLRVASAPLHSQARATSGFFVGSPRVHFSLSRCVKLLIPGRTTCSGLDVYKLSVGSEGGFSVFKAWSKHRA